MRGAFGYPLISYIQKGKLKFSFNSIINPIFDEFLKSKKINVLNFLVH